MFTGVVDPAISALWNRINLAMILQCLPSEIDNESHIDIEAIKIILSARKEMKEREQER